MDGFDFTEDGSSIVMVFRGQVGKGLVPMSYEFFRCSDWAEVQRYGDGAKIDID